MTFRRIGPARPRGSPTPEARLLAEISQIDAQERRLNMELADVFTDVSTPEVTDSEPEDNEAQPAQAAGSQPSTSATAAVPLPSNQSARAKIENMLQAPSHPSQDASFSELYCYLDYRKNVARKMRRMKKMLRTESFEAALRSEAYWAELSRIKDTYPEDGHREHLFELVAFYCYIDTLKKQKETQEGSDTDKKKECQDSDSDEDDDAKRLRIEAPSN